MTMIDGGDAQRCAAALNLSGEHFPCEEPYGHDRAGRGGTPPTAHSNKAAHAIWQESQPAYQSVFDGNQAPENLAEAVFQSLGAASMCWDQTPQGVFESTRARRIGDDLLKWIEERYTEDAQRPRCQTVTQSPWGPTQCALPHDHQGAHAYSPSEVL